MKTVVLSFLLHFLEMLLRIIHFKSLETFTVVQLFFTHIVSSSTPKARSFSGSTQTQHEYLQLSLRISNIVKSEERFE